MEALRWINMGLSSAIFVNSFTTAVLSTKVITDSDPMFIDGWDKFQVATYWISTLQCILLILTSVFAKGSMKQIFHNTLGFPIIGFSCASSICIAIFLFREISLVGGGPSSVNFYVVWYIITYLLTIILSFAQTTVYILFTFKARA